MWSVLLSPWHTRVILGCHFSLFIFSILVNANYLINEASYPTKNQIMPRSSLYNRKHNCHFYLFLDFCMKFYIVHRFTKSSIIIRLGCFTWRLLSLWWKSHNNLVQENIMPHCILQYIIINIILFYKFFNQKKKFVWETIILIYKM